METNPAKQMTTGQKWAALRKCWKAYKIARVQHDQGSINVYKERILNLQRELGIPETTFRS